MMDKIGHSPVFSFVMTLVACMVLMARDSNGDTLCMKTLEVRSGPMTSVNLKHWVGSEMNWNLSLSPKAGATEFQAGDYHCQSVPALGTTRNKTLVITKPDNGEWNPEYITICPDNWDHYYNCPWQVQCESNPFICFIDDDGGKGIFCHKTPGNGCNQ